MKTSKQSLMISGSAIVIAVLGLSSASAQEATVQEKEDAVARQSVVTVTGTRVQRDGFEAPTPTFTLDESLLAAQAANNIADAINTFPTLRAINSGANTGARTAQAGSAYADLRALGSPRTLVLLDGRRVVPSYYTGEVDLNLIPSIAIGRIDIVTGGASAAYGSDAVAGAINLGLKSDVQGIAGDISYGFSERGDNLEPHIGLIGGTDFSGGRGHLMIAGEYVDNKGVGDVYTRDWGREAFGAYGNPDSSSPYSRILVSDYRYSAMATGGLITSGPLAGTTFDPDGTPRSFNYGAAVGSTYMSGGEGDLKPYENYMMVPATSRSNLLAKVSYDISDKLSVFGEAAYADSHTVGVGGLSRDTRPFRISIDNPYIPDATRAAMVSNSLTSISIGRIYTDMNGGFATNDVETEQTRFAFGADGNFGNGWSWDGYAQYGKTDFTGLILNNPITGNFRNALDAVVDPATGNIVCRSTLTDPTNGCAPANIFGSGNVSQAATDYVQGDTYQGMTYEQTVVALNVQGTPFATWAGDVSLAAGVEHREEESSQTVDAISQAGGFRSGNKSALSGSYDVDEVYAELVVPLLADSPLGQSLDLTLATRFTNYSLSGDVTTWKVGASYQMNDSLRLRGTVSHDIRAPNISELFTESLQGNLNITNPATGISANTPRIIGGNPDLQPETAESKMLGFVFTPTFIPGLQISADYYDISIEDVISVLDGQSIVDLCYDGVTSFCSAITYVGSDIVQVNTTTRNFASFETSGVDMQAQYTRDFAGGTVSLRGVATYVDKLTFDNKVKAEDYVGEINFTGGSTQGQPQWKGSMYLTYDREPFLASLSARYVGGGRLDKSVDPDAYENHADDVASRTYYDLNAEYDLMGVRDGDKSVAVYFNIKNLLDQDPPIAPTAFSLSPTNPIFYDTIGRTYKVGARFKF